MGNKESRSHSHAHAHDHGHDHAHSHMHSSAAEPSIAPPASEPLRVEVREHHHAEPHASRGPFVTWAAAESLEGSPSSRDGPIPLSLLERLAQSVPPDHRESWTVLYDSGVHGRSFARMLRFFAEYRGPTLIVVQERPDESTCTDELAMRYLGGYNAGAWRTVAVREKEATSAAAAKARATRLGQSPAPEDGSAKGTAQLPQFFGSADCFVFTSGQVSSPAAEGAPSPGMVSVESSKVRVYPPRNPSENANYQYLYDVHPQADRVGIGMGGQKEGAGVGTFAFFLDRYLARGQCSTRLCPTFGNPRLSSESDFAISRVWLIALLPVALPEAGPVSEETKKRQETLGIKESVLFTHGRQTDKMLLELHGTHAFNDGAYTREDEV